MADLGHDTFTADRAPDGTLLFAADGRTLTLGVDRLARHEQTGGVYAPCVACGTPTHAHTSPRIRVGVLIRRSNPNLGGVAPGIRPQIIGGARVFPACHTDTRRSVWFPKVRVGPGCPQCASKYDALRAERPDAREPFLKWGDDAQTTRRASDGPDVPW